MCKIIAFTDMKKLNLKKGLNDIGNTLLKTETDGFGYAVQGKNGVFGEKTISKQFRSRLDAKNMVQLPIVKKKYLTFGTPGELTGPGIFHGRTSTSGDGLVNTHPMQRPDADGLWHLIHNGVVSDHGTAYSKLTDNDSEDVLYRLMESIESVEEHLSGYYAFAAIDSQGFLHIGRDSHASLYIAWSPVYETYIIATTPGLISKVNKIYDAKCGPIDEMEDEIYTVFLGNEIVHNQYINPRGFTKVEARHSQSSLGRALGGEIIERSDVTKALQSVVSRAARPTPDETSEAQWQSEAQWNNTIDSFAQELSTESETDYYNYKRELDNMDAAYTILDENDNHIKLHEFYKLDHISQELCTIIRPDGTVLELDENMKYKGRLA